MPLREEITAEFRDVLDDLSKDVKSPYGEVVDRLDSKIQNMLESELTTENLEEIQLDGIRCESTFFFLFRVLFSFIHSLISLYNSCRAICVNSEETKCVLLNCMYIFTFAIWFLPFPQVRYLAALMIEANLARTPTDNYNRGKKLDSLCVYARLASLFHKQPGSSPIRLQTCFEKALDYWNQGMYCYCTSQYFVNFCTLSSWRYSRGSIVPRC